MVNEGAGIEQRARNVRGKVQELGGMYPRRQTTSDVLELPGVRRNRHARGQVPEGIKFTPVVKCKEHVTAVSFFRQKCGEVRKTGGGRKCNRGGGGDRCTIVTD